MVGNINSKDYWWAGVLSCIASNITMRPFAAAGLILIGLICLGLYIHTRRKERREERRIEEKKLQKIFLNYLFDLSREERDFRKPKTPRRKTTSRRVKRK